MKTKIEILTLFPEMFSPLQYSIIGRARENGIVDISVVNIRDFSKDKHKKCDDYPFGGGPGMVLMCEPIFNAIENLRKVPFGPATNFYEAVQSIWFTFSFARVFSLLCTLMFLRTCG